MLSPETMGSLIGAILAGILAVGYSGVKVYKAMSGSLKKIKDLTADLKSDTEALVYDKTDAEGNTVQDKLNILLKQADKTNTDLEILSSTTAEIKGVLNRHDKEIGRFNDNITQINDRVSNTERMLTSRLEEHGQRLLAVETRKEG